MSEEPMVLIEDEINKLKNARTEADFYKICDQIKARRNGQYPNYLSRQILDIYNTKFSNDPS